MIRRATVEDLDIVTTLASRLWQEHDYDELKEEMVEFVGDGEAMTLLYIDDDKPKGFALCKIRHDYVEGSESSPNGYLEGIYVEPDARQKGVARELVAKCCEWARSMGCKGFGSDCELDNELSQAFHTAIGFNEAIRIVCYFKEL